MVFEKNGLGVVVSLNLAKGVRYTELVHDDYDDENNGYIYKLTA